MIDLNIPIAFTAGLISFFAPCVVPLIPAYISYATGLSLKDLKKRSTSVRKNVLISSLFYVLGFSVVFVLLGTVAAGVGQYFRRYDLIIQKLGGLVIIIFGLEFAEVIHISFLERTKRFSLPSWINKLGYSRSFLVGVIFATAWTPCVGAVLGSILALAAVTATAVEGASLLFIYSLGISIPFLILSLTLASVPKYLTFIQKRVGIISKVAGMIIVILGLLLLTDTYKYLNSWLFEIAFRFGYEIR